MTIRQLSGCSSRSWRRKKNTLRTCPACCASLRHGFPLRPSPLNTINMGVHMITVYSEGFTAHPTSGTQDDDDDRDDEHAGENEAPIREADDQTEAPEEFEVDEEDEVGQGEKNDEEEETDKE